MRPYTDIPDLRNVVLEESYLLAIVAEPASLEMRGDFVLTPEHLDYRAPLHGEVGYFVSGVLRFHGVRHLVWDGQGAPPARDASSEVDYGHVDALFWDDGVYELEGDWGHIRVVAAEVGLVLRL